MGLFAYIFEISENSDEDIKIRTALTYTNNSLPCCDKHLKEKLHIKCYSE